MRDEREWHELWQRALRVRKLSPAQRRILAYEADKLAAEQRARVPLASLRMMRGVR